VLHHALVSTFAEPFEACNSLENLYRAAVKFSSRLEQQPQAQPALAATVTRRLVRLLRRGWASPEAAGTALPLLVGLRQQGLLAPLRDAQLAVRSCLVQLCKGARLRAPEEAMRLWIQHMQLFSQLIEGGLLSDSEDAATLEILLETELKGCLAGAHPEDLRHTGSTWRLVTEWAGWLSRRAAGRARVKRGASAGRGHSGNGAGAASGASAGGGSEGIDVEETALKLLGSSRGLDIGLAEESHDPPPSPAQVVQGGLQLIRQARSEMRRRRGGARSRCQSSLY